MGEFPSGQRGQTVNLLLFSFGGPNPPSPTKHKQTSEGMSVYVWGESGQSNRFLRSKNLVRRSSDFCNAKIDCGVSNERFFREPHQRSKKCEMQSTHPRRFHLSDIRKDVCLCLGRERIIGPLFHRNHKLIFPRQHPDESKTYVKNRVLLLKNI